jgi:endonuclease III
MSPDPTRARLLAIHERLCAAYGCPIPYHRGLDPLSELVRSLLSHRTRNAQSGRAFRSLQTRFPDWSALAEADAGEVEAIIAGVTWPELKAPRLKEVLGAILDRRGSLDLGFLADLSVAEARAWLEELPGVGPKTSAAVLSFSMLRQAALPVDSHHHRVAERTGLIRPGTSLARAHETLSSLMPAAWGPQEVYDHHQVFMLHGQRCCFPQRPACERCPVLALCPTGEMRLTAPLRQSA